ncbi:hypothetical protein SUGI_0364520 [Cryptomeria japonica]|nr:hypothetical protein SUGI_0364520 [Cryptomeria japonica]
MLTNDSVVILALRNARVGYFNGKLINITAATTLHINPTFPEAEPLTLRGKDPLLVVPFVPEPIHIDGKYTRMTISSILERMSIKPETIQMTLQVVLLFVNLQDATGTLWATAFDEGGIHLVHKTAKQLCALQNDATTIETPCSVIKRLLPHHYSFTLLVSTETYNSESKMKVTVNKVSPVDFKAKCHALLAEIGRLSTQA